MKKFTANPKEKKEWDDDRKASMQASLDSDRRNVRDLWNEALLEYKRIAKKELRPEFNQEKAINYEAMIKHAIGQKENFITWRHDGSDWDNLRSLFKKNMHYIELGTTQLVNAATPSFPPAAVIGTAISYIFAACKSVSDDYDVIVVFFEDMNNFLKRVQIIEQKVPRSRAYQNCLVEVFASFLKMCGYARDYMALGRFKKWIISTVKGQDDELAASRAAMDQSLDHLQNATEFAILANTEDLKSMVEAVEANQKEFNKIASDNEVILKELKEQQDNTLDAVQQLMDFIQQERRKEESGSISVSAGVVAPSVGRVRSAFSDIPGNAIQMQMIRDAHVEGTCEWLWQDRVWKNWVSLSASDADILFLMGEPGIGKSHLAVAAYDQLRVSAELTPDHLTCTVYAFCRDGIDNMRHVNSIVVSTILQISDQNATLREQLNSELNKDGVHVTGDKWDNFFQRSIMPIFEEKSRYQLNLIIDAVNELDPVDRRRLAILLQKIQTRRLRIKVLVTNRLADDARLTSSHNKEVEGLKIDVTRDKILPDLKAILQHRIHSRDSAYQGLARLSDNFRARICDVIESKADTILYAEHMLRHLSTIGRPGAIAKELKDFPKGMSALLLKLEEFTRRRTPADVRPVVRFLLAWMSFGFDPLTLDDANYLVQLSTESRTLLVEEDLQEFLSRFLRIGANLREEEHIRPESLQPTEAQSDDIFSAAPYNDGLLEVVFRERAMREYFRRATESEQSLRLYEFQAHKEIFFSCCQIIANPPSGQMGRGLVNYAVKYSLRHWMCIEGPDQQGLSVLSPADKVWVCGRLWDLISDRSHLAAALESSKVLLEISQMFAFDKSLDSQPFYEMFLDVWDRWSKLLKESSLLGQLDAKASQYWSQDKEKALLPLLKAHIENWLSATDSDSAKAAYDYAHGILIMVSHPTSHRYQGTDINRHKWKRSHFLNSQTNLTTLSMASDRSISRMVEEMAET